eukprot:CAMPEP_0197827626 /NCGR_PEP_ID=MMETSP1437-20131217/4355_1 /TAXON_ID=49252 ORGANISM="Eucampia antarctica, Strain CCMP1452" /NCGR_SAMPLE_ID=MMETSP1437 /ASSEMBLY_ACC=CAM_ASM_001096 /LENGTH=684 /DNA_ID=CAMNT_0043428547 /DNA_START=62 /DNA_END=2116 /DNA_ORIENTATION=+
MKFLIQSNVLSLLLLGGSTVNAFSPHCGRRAAPFIGASKHQGRAIPLHVSIGLGPDADEAAVEEKSPKSPPAVVPEVDHELFRTSRLTKFDEKCDDWFDSILGDGNGSMGTISEEALKRLNQLPALKRQPVLEYGQDEWTPYASNPLPTSPILPAYGLEQHGLPIPRRNAEAWRNFDVAGMIGTDYSGNFPEAGTDIALDESTVKEYTETLKSNGAWIDDADCAGRLVYINGRFAPALSKGSSSVRNLSPKDFEADSELLKREEIVNYFNHLPDGFTDRLKADVPSGSDEFLTSYGKLSCPDHNVGDATGQFAVNTQQGTACFAALNSLKASAVAFVEIEDNVNMDKPVLLVNAISSDVDSELAEGDDVTGVSYNPRSLIVVGENSNLSLVQSCVDLKAVDKSEKPVPIFHNGYTQIYVKGGANMTHAYLEESGGMVTSGVENRFEGGEGLVSPRDVESQRSALRNTHFETLDVHVTGDDGKYVGTYMTFGGNGRSRLGVSASLLRPGAHASLNGFSLSGGAQRTDLRTTIHHIGQATTSKQSQKTMIGGRATTSFRGRIRVEQSAQQTESQQLARTILLSERARLWAIPSLEIIADDVTCTHGATVSDLSDEEQFYLRARGIDPVTARNILMYGFANDIGGTVEPFVQGRADAQSSLKNRIIRRLENAVPTGERAVKGEYQSV